MNDPPSGVEDVHAVRPAGIGALDLVIDRIDENRNRKFNYFGKLLSNVLPFGERLGIGNFKLRRGLATTTNWMCLANIDDVDMGFVLVRLIKLLDRTDRAEERRSGTASEEQNHGLPLQ